jgi:hypothetical protein
MSSLAATSISTTARRQRCVRARLVCVMLLSVCVSTHRRVLASRTHRRLTRSRARRWRSFTTMTCSGATRSAPCSAPRFACRVSGCGGGRVGESDVVCHVMMISCRFAVLDNDVVELALRDIPAQFKLPLPRPGACVCVCVRCSVDDGLCA